MSLPVDPVAAVDADPAATSLESATVHGTAWTAASRLSQQVIQLGVTVVLARLLLPREFGLVAMVTVFTGFASLFVDAGFGAAIVQRKQLTAAHLSTAFWLNVGSGAVIAALSAAVAPLLALFYGQPQLTTIMAVVGLNYVLVSLTIVQTALLERRMLFRRLALLENASLLVGGAVATGCAFAGLGVWSLVLFTLAVSGARSCFLWGLGSWHPDRRFDRVAFRELWGFGGGLLGSGAVNYWSRNADNLLVGRFVGPSALGIYTRAYSLMLFPLTQVSAVVNRTLFPALSRLQESPERVRRGYLRALGIIAFFTFPIATSLYVVARPLVLTLLGTRWAGVIPLVQILAVAAVSDSIGTTTGVIFQSQSRTDILFRWQLVVGVTVISSFAVGVHWGVKGVAASYAIASVALRYPGFVIPGRLIGMRFRDVVQAVWGVLAAALVATAAAWAAGRVLPAEPPAVELLAEIAAAAVVYLAVSHLARLEPYRELRAIASGWRGAATPALASKV